MDLAICYGITRFFPSAQLNCFVRLSSNILHAISSIQFNYFDKLQIEFIQYKCTCCGTIWAVLTSTEPHVLFLNRNCTCSTPKKSPALQCGLRISRFVKRGFSSRTDPFIIAWHNCILISLIKRLITMLLKNVFKNDQGYWIFLIGLCGEGIKTIVINCTALSTGNFWGDQMTAYCCK